MLLVLVGVIVLVVGLFWAMRSPARAEGLRVKEGQPAPDFTLLDQNGKPVRLADQRGKWVVLYFYPKDDTPGCTKEACSFRDNLVALQQLNATVLGVSVDDVASHKAFADKFELNFPILSDEKYDVCKQYGTLTSFMGMNVARRSTMIIDPQGLVRKVYPDVKPTDHALEVHQALKTLQAGA
jgi:peroxiredoxin Q/BCP